MDGDECVLLFLSARTQRAVTPIVKKLRKFKRISLKQGEEKEVCFRLTKEDFTFVDEDMKRRAATGKCDLMIADQKFTIELG